MRRTLVFALAALSILPILPALAGGRPARNEAQGFRQDRYDAQQDFREERREDARNVWEETRENRWDWAHADGPRERAAVRREVHRDWREARQDRGGDRQDFRQERQEAVARLFDR